MSGFGNLLCPKCLEEAIIAITLDDFKTFKCFSCDEEFSIEDVQEIVDHAEKWQKVFQSKVLEDQQTQVVVTITSPLDEKALAQKIMETLRKQK